VKTRGKHETETNLVNARLNPLDARIDIPARSFEQIGRATLRTYRAIAMFGDGHPGRGRDDPGGGRDIERMSTITTGPDPIDRIWIVHGYRHAMVAHRFNKAGDFGCGLSFYAQGDQKTGDLRRCGFAVHNAVGRRDRFFAGQVFTVEKFREQVLDHRRLSRKFRRISLPQVVRIDSGWNWRPYNG
jgi:hypothetical protein